MEKEEPKVDYENEEEVEMKQEIPNPNTTVYIDGFVKPFSVEDVIEHVSKVVAPINTEEHFYMNRQNTYCYVTYKSAEDARKAIDYMHHNRFPPHYGGYLHCRITSVSAESIKDKRPRPATTETEDKDNKRMKNKNDSIVTLEDLFMKTTSKPYIYYKPLTDKEVEEKKRRAKKLSVC